MVENVRQDIKSDEESINTIQNPTTIGNIAYKLVLQKWMVHDTCDQNMRDPLTFNHGNVPGHITNNNICNICGPAIRDNALNSIKDPLEGYAVASTCNREMIPHLSYNSNKYACTHLDHHGIFVATNGPTFLLPKCTNFWV